VVDEYGGTAGILTVTDILRELVGEIPEVDAEVEGIQTLEGGSFEVPAALHVTEVNEALEIDLPEEEDFETLAGFVLARLGHLPKEGESFEENNLAFHILKASDRRVLRVRIQRPA
jgi:CBS domain containing-hemolysin-like protein